MNYIDHKAPLRGAELKILPARGHPLEVRTLGHRTPFHIRHNENDGGGDQRAPLSRSDQELLAETQKRSAVRPVNSSEYDKSWQD